MGDEDNNMVFVIARWDYEAKLAEELNIRKGDRLVLLDDSKSWWQVQKMNNGECGYVPSNFVKKEKTGFISRIKREITKRKTSTADLTRTSHIQQHPSFSEDGPRRDITEDVVDGLATNAVVKYPYDARQDDELALKKGEAVVVLEKSGDGWWRGESGRRTGWFPSNYVEEAGSASGNDEFNNALSDDFIVGVITLYPFKGRNEEELNFDHDEQLDIVEKPADDPDWWRARNNQGEIGLVPRTYVKVMDDAAPVYSQVYIEKEPSPRSTSGMANGRQNLSSNGVGHRTTDLESKIWYHGQIRREESEALLTGQTVEDGDFIIRASETTPNDFSISVRAPNQVKHFKVKTATGKYCIGTRSFDTLDHLVEHYKRSPIFNKDSLKLFLKNPCPNER